MGCVCLKMVVCRSLQATTTISHPGSFRGTLLGARHSHHYFNHFPNFDKLYFCIDGQIMIHSRPIDFQVATYLSTMLHHIIQVCGADALFSHTSPLIALRIMLPVKSCEHKHLPTIRIFTTSHLDHIQLIHAAQASLR